MDLLLQHLYEECNTRGEVVDEFSKSKGSRRTRTKATDSDLKFRLTGFLSGGVNMGTSEHDDDEDEKAVNYKTSGYSFERVVFYNVHDCLRQLAEITGFRFVLLIDEWSCIDMDVQPYFANFLRRCIMDGRHFTVKIASVTGKTQYRKKVDDRECGFEVGADIAVAIDFDELYQIDKNPQKAFFNLYTILLMHLQANNLLEECSTDNLVEMLFTDLKSAFLLVRACEGNVRDFLSILKRCIDELDGIGNTGEWIDSQTVINAAKDWCEQDKLYNMENRLKELLSEIAIFVAHTKKNRGFVMPASYLSHPQLSELFYSRVLHVVQKSRHFPNLGKETMAIVVLDFGAYSEYLMANHDIFFLANDGFESMLFGEFDLSQYDDVMCPFDERRDFKMCFFDPRLNPDIAPSFLG